MVRMTQHSRSCWVCCAVETHASGCHCLFVCLLCYLCMQMLHGCATAQQHMICCLGPALGTQIFWHIGIQSTTSTVDGTQQVRSAAGTPAEGFTNQAQLLQASTGVALGSTGIQEEWQGCGHHYCKSHPALCSRSSACPTCATAT